MTEENAGNPDGQQPGSARLVGGLVVALGTLIFVAIAIQTVDTIMSAGARVTVGVDAAGLSHATINDELPSGSHLDTTDTQFDLVVDELPFALRLASVAGAILLALLTLTGTWLLARVLRDIGTGRPFTEAAPRRLRWLAVVILAAAVLPSALDGAATAAVLAHVDAPAFLNFTIIELSAPMLTLVGVVIVLAQAFSHGQRLSRDVEGLI